MDTIPVEKNIRSPKSLGEMLVDAKLVTVKELQLARGMEKEQGKKLSEILIEQGFITAEDLTAELSIQLNIPFIDLKRHSIQDKALKLIPEPMARSHNVIPMDIVDGSLVVVMSEPWDIRAINDMVAQSGMKVQPTIGIASDIKDAIDLNYKSIMEIERQLSRIVLPPVPAVDGVEASVIVDPVKETPVVQTIDLLIKQAIRQRTSDIHIEPQRERLRIRYRIDGVLHDVMSLPLDILPALISRLKIIAGLNIAEHRLPQDGQFSIMADGKKVDIRLATSITAYGESAVLRVLDKSGFMLDLPRLGFSPDTMVRYEQMLHSPFGLILVAGPTGSGKTTTLYASVNELDRMERNIITIEDPVEYLFDDINQIQVNPKSGLTFSRGLRSIMRLDPDVILVGEIRDNDTANTSVQAALTGHLVLASIHGNDAAGALFRIVNLGVESFLVSTALLGIVAQRMVRRVCPHCRTLIERPLNEQLAFEKETGERRTKFYMGMGCNFCSNSGFLGRIGVFEVILMSEAIRQRTSATEIREQAIKEGMVPMIKDGMLKVKEGITTPGEVMRNIFTI